MDYKKHMRYAINMAANFKYTAKPNPVVGALILERDQIICEGFHERYGGPHAEVNCLEQLEKLRNKQRENLTLLCTLEPCNHFGKTPPCTDEIIKSGVKNVVIGSVDPNPKVSGSGIKKMQENGIKVTHGVLEEEARKINEYFFFKHADNRPFITIKIASSKDGKSHDAKGSTTWITSEDSRNDVQLLRAEHDVILTGGNTVRNDNPRMNARVNFPVNQPKKILLSSQKIWDMNFHFFKNADFEITNETDLSKIMRSSFLKESNSIMVEAGPKLVNAFLKNRLCDRLVIYKSQVEIGNDGVNWFENDNVLDKYGFKIKSNYTIGPDIKMVLENG